MAGGLHVNTWTPQARESVRRVRPRVLKVLNTARDADELRRYKESRPDGVVIYREVLDGVPFEQRIERLLRGVEPIRQFVDYVETPINEELQDWATLDQHNALSVEWTRRLHAEGYKVLCGNFSVGNPPTHNKTPDEYLQHLASVWGKFHDALREADGLSLHEYGAPSMHDGVSYWCGRHHDVYRVLPPDLRKPLFITECGIDLGLLGRARQGWKHSGFSADQYAAQLEGYLESCLDNPDFVGATVFCCGNFGDWDSFDAAGFAPIEQVIRDYSTFQEGSSSVGINTKAANALGILGGVSVVDLRKRYEPDTSRYPKRGLHEISRIVFHHAATREPENHQDAIALLDAIHVFHRDDHKWAGIGYHLAIAPFGAIYWVNDPTVISNHVADNNHNTLGVVFLGSYETTAPPTVAVAAARLTKLGADAALGKNLELWGHAELNPKSTGFCPSRHWGEIKRQILTGGVVPVVDERSVLAQFDALWGQLNAIEQAVGHARGHLINSKGVLGLN